VLNAVLDQNRMEEWHERGPDRAGVDRPPNIDPTHAKYIKNLGR
jgi:hypothetical protein